MDRIKQYIAMRDAKPMPQLGDHIHTVNAGTEWEGVLSLSDIRQMIEGLERKDTLLRACLSLLEKQDDSNFTLDLLSETVRYDDADCDGYCLMDDIRAVLA